MDGDLTHINSRYSVFHAPLSDFKMCLLGILPYTVFPQIFTLNSTFSLNKSGVSLLQKNPNFSLYGEGVLIGFVDTGIDYRHEAFLNQDGTTRIYSIWDQTLHGGIPPKGFTFGSEFKQDEINDALKSENPMSVLPSEDENGHGTMLAGIAAGSPNIAEEFSGVAPGAELVVVKLKKAKEYNRAIFCVRNDIDCYLDTDIMMGIEYLRSVASQSGRPLVICFGLGSSQGDHNGESAFPAYFNTIASYHNIAVSVAAGNEGNDRRHYRGIIAGPDFHKNFELRIGEEDGEFFCELWNHTPYRLTITITTPTSESTKTIYPRLNECREFNFVFESTVLYVNNIILEEESGAQLILLRFQHAMKGVWSIRVVNIDNQPSVFDAWLPSGSIISTETYFLESTPDITVTNPGNARNPLTVTAYNQFNDSILIQSSRGFSASGEIVPDLAAPGYQLACPLPGNRYGSATGTGAAAAHAAGIQAMMMEWAVVRGYYDTITGRDIARLLVRGAFRKDSVVYPNTIWGFGQIDIMGLFDRLRL